MAGGQQKLNPDKLNPVLVKKLASGEITLKDADGFTAAQMATMARTGYTLFTQGRYKDAEIIFSGLEALDPHDVYYPNALGAVFLAQNRLPEAQQALDRALKINPKHLGARVNRGEVYLRLGDKVKEAIADFEEANKIDPKTDTPFGKRARVLLAATQAALKQGK